MISQALLGIGAIIYLMLGTLHLLYTFFSSKFRPFDPAVEEVMKGATPRITRKTTMWKAWTGFNASHSTGAMFYGFMLLYFAAGSFHTFEQSVLLQIVAMFHSVFYFGLARAYWFSIPRIGIALATLSLGLSLIFIYFS